MSDKKHIEDKIRENRAYFKDSDVFSIERDRIIAVLEDVRDLFFPGYFGEEKDIDVLYEDIRDNLTHEVAKVDVDYENTIETFMEKLPELQLSLYRDTRAIYDGDPAAKTISEIVLSFPGFLAVLTYRVAHVLYELNVPIIPRIMAEYAHEKTGIDINPGARIGEYFCIDHGTGIVIGETATVGDHVRMYHGVTLGVRKFAKDEEGKLLKGGKRHPDVGNYVTIYANATVLGGDTVIDDHTAVATNSLITESIKEK